LPPWSCGLPANALCSAVGAFAVGELEDLVDRRAVAIVDPDCADLLGQFQPIGMAIDDHDLRRASDLCGQGGHQADGAASVDDDRLPGLQAGQLDGVVAGWPDVGEHDVVGFLFLGVVGQTQAIEVAVRYDEILGLPTLIRAHLGVAVTGAGVTGIHGETGTRQAALAVLAIAAAAIEWHTDAIADFDAPDRGSDFDDFPEVLVADDAAPRFSWPTMRPFSRLVRPSYMCRSEPQILVLVILTSTSVG
jgi:hypothetical protein